MQIFQNICIVIRAAMIYMSATISVSYIFKSTRVSLACSYLDTITLLHYIYTNSKEVACIYLLVVSMTLEAVSDFPNSIMLLLQH